jgi:DNA-binding beta-propeller fold protein YncE
MRTVFWLLVPALFGTLAPPQDSPAHLPPGRAAAAAPALPSPVSRVTVWPSSADVFSGAGFRFRASVSGAQAQAPRWMLVGPGSLGQDGTYTATAHAGASAALVASIGQAAGAALARVVLPPAAGTALLLAGCYDDGAVDVRSLRDLRRIGMLASADRAGGLAVDARARTALISVADRVWALDLRSMRWRASAPVRGASFSQIAQLSGGVFAVADNYAHAGGRGVRLFKLQNAQPVLVASINAGETPEGIIATRSGQGFIVSNVNGDSVMRFMLDRRGNVHANGTALTGHRPFGIAEDVKRHLLFVALNDNATVNGAFSRPGLQVFDSVSLRRIGKALKTGGADALPLGVALDAGSNRLFVTNEGEGDVAVWALPQLRRIGTLQTGPTPWQPAVDTLRHRLYVPSAGSNSIDVFDTRTLRRIGAPLPTCGYPTTIAPLQAPS